MEMENEEIIIENESDTDETTDLEQESAPVTDEKRDYYAQVIRVDLDDDQKKKLLRLIDERKSAIIEKLQSDKYFTVNAESLQEYELNRDQDEGDTHDIASKKQLPLFLMMVDIISSKAKRQTLTPRPICIIEPEDEMTTEDKTNRENYLDMRARQNSKIEEVVDAATKMSCIQRAAVIKIPFCREVEYRMKKKVFKPDQKEEYLKTVDGNKLLNTESLESKNYGRLLNDETVSIQYEDEVVTFHGAKPYRVPLDKFWADPYIADMQRQPLICEELDEGWYDIERKQVSGYYDEEAVEELKKKKGEEYKEAVYKVEECIILCALPDLDDVKARTYRFLVTYDLESEVVLRCVYYPHDEVFYVPVVAFSRDDRWYGYSLYEREKELIDIANAFLRSSIDEINLAHTPTMFTDDVTFEAARKELMIGNVNVIAAQKGTNFNQLKMEFSSQDRVAYINWLQNMAELVSGAQVALMSGAETPNDPRAPAAKTAMKLQESNARVEDLVLNMQKGFAFILRQIEKIDYDYPEVEGAESVYWTAGQKRTIKREVLKGKSRHVMHGSRLSFDKSLDLQVVMQAMNIFKQFFPILAEDLDVQYTFANAYINNSPGSIEQNRERLLKPLKLAVEAKDERKKMLAAGKQPPDMGGQGMRPQMPAGQPQLPQGAPMMPQGQPEGMTPEMAQQAMQAMQSMNQMQGGMLRGGESMGKLI